eukprot:TRINITY_DN8458_c0_g2_i1.p2 TRINITY_DN8458_c0_g2~~TRINITY_DN8458_c0_g2_i1.p2  ORF type:complete len:121 (+),score=19.11 TRINITY_DN8458_c0_g2_i1:498-860(+)
MPTFTAVGPACATLATTNMPLGAATQHPPLLASTTSKPRGRFSNFTSVCLPPCSKTTTRDCTCGASTVAVTPVKPSCEGLPALVTAALPFPAGSPDWEFSAISLDSSALTSAAAVSTGAS